MHAKRLAIPRSLIGDLLLMMFIITLLCVYLVFGYQWMNGDPLSELEVAKGSAKFANCNYGISSLKTLQSAVKS